MSVHSRYALIILIFVGFCGGGWYWYAQQGTSSPGGGARVVAAKAAHLYKDPSVSIRNIHLALFYVVPKNRAEGMYEGWKNSIEQAASQVASFHGLQFRGTSNLRIAVFPEPIVLEEESIFYESSSTDRGNPRALVAVASEVERRVFQGGDLSRAQFAGREEDAYPVMGLIYEGVGASGGRIYESDLKTEEEIAKELGVAPEIVYKVDVKSSDGFFLLNRSYLTNEDRDGTALTLLYHEFAHAIGIPDAYDGVVPLSDDVMSGEQNIKPLPAAYLDRIVLKAMGVIGE